VQSSGHASMESLFGDAEVLKPSEPAMPPVEEWPTRERLKKEREYLNFYISGHPLQEYSVDVSSFSTLQLHKLDASLHGQMVRLCGIVSDVRTRLDKRENTIAFVKVEQYVGSCECVFWSDKYRQFAPALVQDAVLVIIGKCEINGENVKIIVDDVMTLDQARKKLPKGYVLRIHPETVDVQAMQALKARCNGSDATDRLSFCVMRPDGMAVYDAMTTINVNDDTTSFLIETFGDQNVRFSV
jgi:DNA polymerase III subunit alpha